MKQEIACYCVAAIAAISSAQAIDGLKVQTNHFNGSGTALTLSTKSSRELSLIDWRLTRELDKLALQYDLSYFIQPQELDDGLEILMI